MFKDIKAFLSSFIRKAKEHNLFKKYLGITLAGILAILIPVVIAVLYIQLKDDPIAETQLEEISVTIFDNDGHTISSEKAPADSIKDSPFISIIYNMINKKDLAKKPDNFNQKPTFNVSIATNDIALTYKCYFEKSLSSSFIEDSSGNFFLPRESEYKEFLNSSFSQAVYPESVPPSLTIEKNIPILPKDINWSYKLTDGTVQESTNFDTADKSLSYMISGAIDFVFSDVPSECSIKIKAENDEIIFDGTFEETADFTANDGDKFTVFINAKWADEKNKLAFGHQSYEFDIVCTKPSAIEVTPQNTFGGSFVKISVSDVNNPETIVYTAKDPKSDNDAIKALYEFIPTFKKHGQNAYAFLPIPNNISKGTFEFSISYGITKADFSLSLAERSVPANSSLSTDDFTFKITNKIKNDFSKILKDTCTSSSDAILFTSEFLSPEEYGFTKSVEYNSEILIDEESSFKFFANSYTSAKDESIAIKSANIGTVRAVGYSDILGNYVAVDHGAGLYTWYCGLSDVSVFKGDILKKGEFIGRSGSTSPLCKNGVNIFCTLYGSLISPSDILGQNLV